MNRDQERATVDGYCIQVLIVNGEVQDQHSQKSLYIENIGKGGFRFVSNVRFELEDRVQVLLRFPDGFSQEVLGRICYIDAIGNNKSAYGFSVIEGFYSLGASRTA
jgi:Tfp pilus assembly protein PilZ